MFHMDLSLGCSDLTMASGSPFAPYRTGDQTRPVDHHVAHTVEDHLRSPVTMGEVMIYRTGDQTRPVDHHVAHTVEDHLRSPVTTGERCRSPLVRPGRRDELPRRRDPQHLVKQK